MDKPAETSVPINELISKRWSPYGFGDKAVDSEILTALFEAARWAPSCFNEQPWRFIVANRENLVAFERLSACVMDGNSWARDAAVLMVTVVSTQFARNGKPNDHARHDLGLAVGNLMTEATARGLVLHQMAGFHADKAQEDLGIPEGYEPVTMIALGYPGNTNSLSDKLRDREMAPRSRKALDELVHQGTWSV